MNFVKFASASEDVKIWERENCVLSETVTPHSGPISSISWSPDGQFLVSCPKSVGRPVISVFRPKFEASYELPPEIQHSHVRFGNTSNRHIAACGANSDVLIWDVRSRRVKKNLKSTIAGKLNCVVFNSSDTHVACGGRDGSVGLVNFTTNIAYEPLIAPDVTAVLAMEFGHSCRTFLATSSDDGSCCLWDTHSWKLSHCFLRSHLAPATDIAISPVNDTFLTTAGLDRNIVTYDSRSKKILKSKKTDEPMTAIDFTRDGCHLVVGDFAGGISIFDLRSFNAGPVKSFVAHRSPVYALRILKQIVDSKTDMSINNALNKRALPSSPSRNSSEDKKITPNSNRQLQNKVDLQTPASILPRMRSPGVTNVIDVLSPMGAVEDSAAICDNHMDPFPGLKGGNKETFSPQSASRLTMSPSGSPRGASGGMTKSTSPSAASSVPSFKLNVQPPSPIKTNSFGYASSVSRQPSPRPPRPPPPTKPRIGNEVVKSECQDVKLSAMDGNSNPAENGEASSGSSSATVHNFPMALFQSVVSDIVEKLRDQHHADIVNLHVQMVKLNHRLQGEIEKVAEKVAVNDELVKEICRLNEENRRLRFRF